MSTIGKILTGLVIIFLIGAGYKFLIIDKATVAPKSLTAENFDLETKSENQEFLRILKSLENVGLDKSIFSKEAFLSLVDFSLQLGTQPKGRFNPFRPIDLLEISLADNTDG